MNGAEIDDRLTQSVELVSHEIRASILVALAVLQRESPEDPTLRFSELRECVGHDDRVVLGLDQSAQVVRVNESS